MGTDIHLFAEIKIKDKWCFYGEIWLPRNYEVFAIIKTIAKNQGLPKNISDILAIHYREWAEDAHSISWFEKEEIEIFMKKIRRRKDLYYSENWMYIIGNLFGNKYYNIDKYRSDYPPEIQDCRWIFWFDN